MMASVGGIYAKLYHLKNGESHAAHVHTYDHITLLAAGSARVGDSVFHAPHIIVVRKHTMHGFTALEDGTVLACIHRVRHEAETDEIFDESMLPKGTKLVKEVR